MKKNILIKGFMFLLTTGLFYGQNTNVGINTDNPLSTMDVRAKNDNGTTQGNVTSTDGVLVSRVTNLTVNGTVESQLVYLVADNGTFKKGFHYWSGAVWKPIDSVTEPWNDSSTSIASNSLSNDKYINGRLGINTSSAVNTSPSLSTNDVTVNGTLHVATIPNAVYDTNYGNTAYLTPIFVDGNGNVVRYQETPFAKSPGGSNMQIAREPFTLTAGQQAANYTTIDMANWGTLIVDIMCYDTVTKDIFTVKFFMLDYSNSGWIIFKVIQSSNTRFTANDVYTRTASSSTTPGTNVINYSFGGVGSGVSFSAVLYTNDYGGGVAGRIRITNTGTNTCVYQIKSDKIF